MNRELNSRGNTFRARVFRWGGTGLILLAASPAAAGSITFEAPTYTTGTFASVGSSTGGNAFTGQDGWSASSSTNAGSIIATATSGSYVGGQALVASATTYIGAKKFDLLAGGTSYSFDIRYAGSGATVGGWFDTNSDDLYAQSETGFQAGTVTGSKFFGIRAAGFGTEFSSGVQGTTDHWYRLTATAIEDGSGGGTVTLSVFNLTTDTQVDLNTSVAGVQDFTRTFTADQFGPALSTYQGVFARSTATPVDNITSVPEPAAAGLIALGAVGLLGRRNRQRASRA